MRSHLRSASLWLAVAIGGAGCSASLVSPGDDAGPAPNVAGDAGGTIAPVDASTARDASGNPPVGAIIYPSPHTVGNSVLTLSNEPISCGNRSPTTECSTDGASVRYMVTVEIPPLDVAPGVYALSTLVNPYFSATGHNFDAPGSCWGGGGSFVDGTLEIVSASNTSLVFRFQDTDTFSFDVNGTAFVAQVCPGA